MKQAQKGIRFITPYYQEKFKIEDGDMVRIRRYDGTSIDRICRYIDEYHVEVETWDGIVANVRENYETFLRKGMDNEIDRSNRALYSAQVDTDAMNVDQEFRLTLLELGLTELDI